MSGGEPVVTSPGQRRPRILVVDDEPDIVVVLVDFLRLDGYDVDTAANGAEALRLLAQRPYDMVLSDWKMPVLDGIGLYRVLERRHGALRDRFAFLTGNVLEPDLRASVELAHVPVIEKPFEIETVRRVMRRLAERLTDRWAAPGQPPQPPTQ